MRLCRLWRLCRIPLLNPYMLTQSFCIYKHICFGGRCILSHTNNVNLHSADRNVPLLTAAIEIRKFRKNTHISSNISVHNAQRRPRERSPLDNEWPLLYHRCITVWCGTEQRHSSHSKKTPCWFISCLLKEPSLVRVLKGLCLLGLNYALSPAMSQRSDLNLQI